MWDEKVVIRLYFLWLSLCWPDKRLSHAILSFSYDTD